MHGHESLCNVYNVQCVRVCFFWQACARENVDAYRRKGACRFSFLGCSAVGGRLGFRNETALPPLLFFHPFRGPPTRLEQNMGFSRA